METREAAKIRIQLALNELMYENGELDFETYQLVNIALLERLTGRSHGNTMERA